jgi:hypothetical protein
LVFEFANLDGEELLKRTFRANSDFDCYKRICQYYFGPDEVRLRLKEYRNMGKAASRQALVDVSQNCSDRHPRFDSYCWEDVLLEALYENWKERILPESTFDYIFGHTEYEEDLYALVWKALEREYNAENQVFDTHDLLGNKVRFADFTVITKKNFLRGQSIHSFEVKTRPAAFETFLNQASDFARFSKHVYLVATPGFILKAGVRFNGVDVGHADLTIKDKLSSHGIGLYIFDLTSKRFDRVLDPQSSDVYEDTREKALRILAQTD